MLRENPHRGFGQLTWEVFQTKYAMTFKVLDNYCLKSFKYLPGTMCMWLIFLRKKTFAYQRWFFILTLPTSCSNYHQNFINRVMLPHFIQFTGMRRDTYENYPFNSFTTILPQKTIVYLSFQLSELNKYSKINKNKKITKFQVYMYRERRQR